MVRTANPNLSVTISATNESGPALSAAAAEFNKVAAAYGATALRIKASNDDIAKSMTSSADNIGKSWKEGGAAMSKAGSIATALGSSLGTLGGDVGRVGGSIASLAGMIASGGPFGLALAAIPVAVGAAAAAFKFFTQEAQQALDEAAALAEFSNGRIAKVLGDGAKEVERLTNNLRELRGENTEGGRLLDAMIKRENILSAMRNASANDSVEVRKERLAALDVLQRTIPLMEQEVQLKADNAREDAARAARAKGPSVTFGPDLGAGFIEQEMEAQDKRVKEGLAEITAAVEASLANEMAADAARVASAHKAIDEILAARIEAHNQDLEMIEARNEAEEKAADERRQIQAASANAIISVGGALASAMMSQRREMSAAERADAQAQMAVRMAVATAQGIVSAMTLPYPGNIVAAISTAATVAAMFAELATFKDGGIVGEVQKSMGDRDAIPIIAHRGEAVLTKEQTDSLRHTLGVRGGGSMATGGVVSGRGGGGGTIVNNFAMLVPDRQSQLKIARTVTKSQKVLQRRRMA